MLFTAWWPHGRGKSSKWTTVEGLRAAGKAEHGAIKDGDRLAAVGRGPTSGKNPKRRKEKQQPKHRERKKEEKQKA